MAEPKKVAAVVTEYRKWSHADVIVGKVLEGYNQDGGPGPDLDGRDAMVLWARFQKGDRTALVTLLRYNAEDLEGMMFIRRHPVVRLP